MYSVDIKNQDDLVVLLSWDSPPGYVPPLKLSKRQVTLCSDLYRSTQSVNKYDSKIDLWAPSNVDYDLYEVVQKAGITAKIDLVVVQAFSIKSNRPHNTKAFGCPTLLIVGDTHHMVEPISHITDYACTEKFDFVTSFHDRQHLHWFFAAGIEQIGWFPLASVEDCPSPWNENRIDQIAFVGQYGALHPYRKYLLQNLAQQGIPLDASTAPRVTAAQKYANSIISFNCSLNGDINLRNFEILSAGGFLLTDRLSPQSGFDLILTPGEHCETYSSQEELIEKVKFYRQRPDAALRIARQGHEHYQQFHRPEKKARQIIDWVLRGNLPDLYNPHLDQRFAISRQYQHLLSSRILLYEKIQEIHRQHPQLSVLLAPECPAILALDLIDLPRLSVYVMESAGEVKELARQAGVLSQLKCIDLQEASSRVWDILVVMADTPTVLDNTKVSAKIKYSFSLPASLEDGRQQFTNDWFLSVAKPNWDQLLPRLKPQKILEIGSYEGAFACYCIKTLSPLVDKLEIYCVDTWEDSMFGSKNMSSVRQRFKINTAIEVKNAACPVKLVCYKEKSITALSKLIAQGMSRSFDSIYIDGSHEATDVIADAILAFELLRKGGIIAFDDYLWGGPVPQQRDLLSTPKIAIDTFTNIFFKKVAIASAPLYQIYATKIAD